MEKGSVARALLVGLLLDKFVKNAFGVCLVGGRRVGGVDLLRAPIDPPCVAEGVEKRTKWPIAPPQELHVALGGLEKGTKGKLLPGTEGLGELGEKGAGGRLVGVAKDVAG